MTKTIKLTLAVSTLVLLGTAQAQNVNQRPGKQLQAAAATQPMTTEAPYYGHANAGFVQPSPAQEVALDKLFNQRITDKILARMVISAKTIIRRAIMASACATTPEAMNELNDIRLKPKSYTWQDKTDISRTNLKYHDAHQCTSIARLAFKKLAANAVEVEVYYISPSSHEADHQRMQFRNVAGSGWLIDEIYMTFS